jgi:hypothetical protein
MKQPLRLEERDQVTACTCNGFACGTITSTAPFRATVSGAGDDCIVVVTAAGSTVAGGYHDRSTPDDEYQDLIISPENGNWSEVEVGDLAFNWQCSCPSHSIVVGRRR